MIVDSHCQHCGQSVWTPPCNIAHQWRKVEIANGIRRKAGLPIKEYPIPEGI